ncbi:hypothetical protein AX774_g2297 [Zancudomyces culisetae]|uniref:Uncharacterized protein n=1 Tax=Zancudomyces culisetae TaxID=1213189 RepID=A0A1R1PT99_ZANCU|nr:hypothetical protein AX774_g2297 [Zancudomyces culisetae]|eukprot:OMH84181.1 hypothetical protein AX774_g2297 [Zancudomyces culisetae]
MLHPPFYQSHSRTKISPLQLDVVLAFFQELDPLQPPPPYLSPLSKSSPYFPSPLLPESTFSGDLKALNSFLGTPRDTPPPSPPSELSFPLFSLPPTSSSTLGRLTPKHTGGLGLEFMLFTLPRLLQARDLYSFPSLFPEYGFSIGVLKGLLNNPLVCPTESDVD